MILEHTELLETCQQLGMERILWYFKERIESALC